MRGEKGWGVSIYVRSGSISAAQQLRHMILVFHYNPKWVEKMTELSFLQKLIVLCLLFLWIDCLCYPLYGEIKHMRGETGRWVCIWVSSGSISATQQPWNCHPPMTLAIKCNPTQQMIDERPFYSDFTEQHVKESQAAVIRELSYTI